MKNKLRILRAERKLSQDDLARECGVSRATIHAIENEKVIPSGYTMLMLSKTFQLPIEEIFFDFSVVYKQQSL